MQKHVPVIFCKARNLVLILDLFCRFFEGDVLKKIPHNLRMDSSGHFQFSKLKNIFELNMFTSE